MSLESPNTEEYFKGNLWVLPTDINLVEKAIEAFENKLVSDAGWEKDSDDVYWFTLCLDEAIANAIGHGNLGIKMPEDSDVPYGKYVLREQEIQKTDKKVRVDINIDGDTVSVTVRDEGNGFNWKGIPDPTAPDGLRKRTGRGVLIMEKYLDSFHYNEKGNEITMVKTKGRTNEEGDNKK